MERFILLIQICLIELKKRQQWTKLAVKWFRSSTDRIEVS
ncbi:protein of unknown function [Cardinium endosymbiont cEper1 of Encarsia pergandiella]|nr:protein of unknown function [Cardinium endosymbiont cEper1 of Encarsia pergandiella]